MQTMDISPLVERWKDWREIREAELRAPYGWLSLTALYWLDDQPRELDGLPGIWRVESGKVRVDVGAEEGLQQDDRRITGSTWLAPADGFPGVSLAVGEIRLEVIRRGDMFGVRVRDPKAPTRTSFRGVPTYDYDPDWVVLGRFIPYDSLRRISRSGTRKWRENRSLERRSLVVGEIEVDRDGDSVSLVVTKGCDMSLLLLFQDLTSGVTTASGARELAVDRSESGYHVFLDFNRAVNLPGTFTSFCTSPLAPPRNILPWSVTAGEQLPK